MSTELIQLIVGGILLGGIYGLAAFGLSISYGVLNVLNLAHGEFLMLGAIMGYAAFVHLGLNPFAAAIIELPVFMCVGALFYVVLLKPIADRPPQQQLIASILITLGASLVIEDLAAFFWERPVTGIAYSMPALEIHGVLVSSVRLLVLLFISALAAVLQLYLARTFVGRAIRAVTQSREGAQLVGIPISRVYGLTFGLGVALAACAGVFYATLFTVTPSIGIPLTVKYLCVVVMGGLGSLVGSVTGGVVLGLAETLTAYFLGTEWSPCIAFVLLLGILVVKPQGLFRAR